MLLLPALLSAFSCVVVLFNKEYNLALSFAFIVGLRPLMPDDLGVLFVGLGVLIVYVPIALYAAKGKFWCFLIGALLYAADFGYSFTLLGQGSLTILQISIHSLFLVAFALGAFFYYRADKLLQSNEDDILRK